MKTLISIALLTLMASTTTAQDAVELTTARTFKNDKGEALPYRIFTPAKLPKKPIPLVIFLHGAGERGDDNKLQLKHAVIDLIDYSLKNESMIIIAPQCPEGKKWAEVDWSAKAHTMPKTPSCGIRLTLELVDNLCKEFFIDKKRLYITGLSMGGYGTWDMIQRKPDMFAAAIPVCGGGDIACAPVCKDQPIWAFHGDKDGAVPVSRSRDMVKALKKIGGNVKYTEYPGVGHNCWSCTYANEDVLKWFFSQKRE